MISGRNEPAIFGILIKNIQKQNSQTCGSYKASRACEGLKTVFLIPVRFTRRRSTAIVFSRSLKK
jgi:hypothetical protein